MTAATLMKRINTVRKEITRYEKEIKHYADWMEEIKTADHRAYCNKWIEYYMNQIKKHEVKIAELSKQAAVLASEEEHKAMIKALADHMRENGFRDIGYTTNGKCYSIDHNKYGFTDRTDHCFTMRIDGETVFTSGTIETVAAYILNN